MSNYARAPLISTIKLEVEKAKAGGNTVLCNIIINGEKIEVILKERDFENLVNNGFFIRTQNGSYTTDLFTTNNVILVS